MSAPFCAIQPEFLQRLRYPQKNRSQTVLFERRDWLKYSWGYASASPVIWHWRKWVAQRDKKWFATLILSPTRLWAKSKIENGEMTSVEDIRRWNLKFQLIAGLACVLSLCSEPFGYTIPAFIIVAIGILAFGRMNELLIAFYNDVFDKLAGKAHRISMTREDRIKLLGAGYVETIVLYGLMHLAAQAIAGKGSYTAALVDAFHAVYFSAMTITTTGFGDIAPVYWLPRLITMCEAVTGIVYLALALAVYVSVRESGSRAEGGKETGSVSNVPPSLKDI